MRTLTALATAASLTVASTAFLSASATAGTVAAADRTGSAEGDWRQDACVRAIDDAELPTGDAVGVVVASVETPVPELPGVVVVVDRLDFSGANCELISFAGRLPFPTDVRRLGYEQTVRGDLVVDGVVQDTAEMSSQGGSSALVGGPRVHASSLRQTLLGKRPIVVTAFRSVETGTFPGTCFPAEWQNKPYTLTHTGSDWSIRIKGSRLVRKTFDVTPATTAAAERRLHRELRAARTPAERAAARKDHRLALRGVKLVRRPLKVRLSGSTPATSPSPALTTSLP